MDGDGVWRGKLALLGDVLLALAIFGLSVQAIAADSGDCDCQVTGWAYVAAAGQTLPVAARRLAPFAVNLVVAPSAVIAAMADWPALPAPLGALIAIHAAAAYAHRWQAALVLVAALVAVPAVLLTRDSGTDTVEGVHTVLVVVIAWLLGNVTRYRRTALLQSRQREEMLDRLRVAEAAGAAAAERSRIAREMHDLLSHSVSVMVVLAEGGAAAAESGGRAAAPTFDSIAERGRRTLTELRAMLGVLRTAPDTGPPRPLPGLPGLSDLVAETRAAGVDVALHGDTGARVGPATGLAVYRIVQESLTNAVKHAPGTPVRVECGGTDQTLRVRVTNPLPDPAATGAGSVGGHGVRGMHERAASVGGRLDVGAVGDRWTVDLRVPLEEG